MTNFSSTVKNLLSVIKTQLQTKMDSNYVSADSNSIKVGENTIKVCKQFSAMTSDGKINLLDGSGNVVSSLDLTNLYSLASVGYHVTPLTVVGPGINLPRNFDIAWAVCANNFNLNLSYINVNTVKTVIINNTGSSEVTVTIVPNGTLHMLGDSAIKVASGKITVLTVVVVNYDSTYHTLVSAITES